MQPPIGFDDSLFDADEYLYFLEQALQDEDTGSQIQFAEHVLAMTPPMRVLDLGCGHGRHANALARRGYRVHGVDRIEGFLAIARREAGSAPVTYERADLAAITADAAYDRALCIYDVLGYFDDAHSQQVLAAAHRALVPGGKLLLDLRTREWLVRLPPAAIHELPNGDLMLDRYSFDVLTSRFIDRRTYIRGGVRRDIAFSVRVWTLTEMRTILDGIGFAVTHVFGGFDRRELTADAYRMILVCAKR